jgi:hypothetical protein
MPKAYLGRTFHIWDGHFWKTGRGRHGFDGKSEGSRGFEHGEGFLELFPKRKAARFRTPLRWVEFSGYGRLNETAGYLRNPL